MVAIPQIGLVLAGLCALLNIWLSFRVGQVRRSERIFTGDGGNDRVIRRMRAHANFAENAPLVVVLVLAIELARGPSAWLWLAAVAFVAGRILHGLGMDGWRSGRGAGTGLTMVVQLALAVGAIAIAIPLTAHRDVGMPTVETMVPQG